MWFADLILDLLWFSERKGDLGEARAAATQIVTAPDMTIELLLYGDDVAIRHLRVLLQVEDQETADACVNKNIVHWINSLEVASALATPTFSTVATLNSNSTNYMLIMGKGGREEPSVSFEPIFTPPPVADFAAASALLKTFSPDCRVHLHYFSRFLNCHQLPEVRWLNGYRLMEWHFLRGKVNLEGNNKYREFLNENAAGFDPFRRDPTQQRWGVIKEIRALAAHAILSKKYDDNVDPIIASFPALEILVSKIMTLATKRAISFYPKDILNSAISQKLR